jgi:mannosyltransferase OCH1-like enzyme
MFLICKKAVNIQGSDMIRYIVLHDFGGVYSDLDLYPVKNIKSV